VVDGRAQVLTCLSRGAERRADALAELGVGDPIPKTLYEAVAEFLRELAGE
jgi:type III secretion system FlhB-like substrate exporter